MDHLDKPQIGSLLSRNLVKVSAISEHRNHGRSGVRPIKTTVNAQATEYQSNYAAMHAAVARLTLELSRSTKGGGEKYAQRHLARGKLLPRERMEMLLDEGSYFLEIAPLAGISMENESVGAGGVGGIGLVSGRECLIIANEATVKGGAVSEIGQIKNRRLSDIGTTESPAEHKPGRVRGSRPSRAGENLRARRPGLPRNHPPLQGPNTEHLRSIRQLDGRRRVPTGDVRFRRHGQEPGAGLSGRAAAGEDGDGRSRRRRGARRGGDALADFGAV